MDGSGVAGRVAGGLATTCAGVPQRCCRSQECAFTAPEAAVPSRELRSWPYRPWLPSALRHNIVPPPFRIMAVDGWRYL